MIDIKDYLEESDGEKEPNEGEERERVIQEADSSDEEETPVERKQKKKRNHDPLGIKKRKENLRGTGDTSFFADLWINDPQFMNAQIIVQQSSTISFTYGARILRVA